jgi:glucosamine--fructose-6-phosphate aminotransferase (isomerizing)
MCGIAGIIQINQNNLNTKVMNILKEQEHRGSSSCGVAYFVHKKSGEYMNTIKELTSPSKFDIKSYKINSNILIAHNRAPSVGEVKIQNAHPFLDCTSRIALVHNGTSSTIKAVKPILEMHGHKLKGNTDSEIFAHIVEDFMNNSDDIDVAVKKFFEYLTDIVNANFTILIMLEDEYIYALTNNEDLKYSYNNNEVLIASEYDAIKKAMDNTKYTSVKPSNKALIKFHKQSKIYIDYLDGNINEKIEYDPKQPDKNDFKEDILIYYKHYQPYNTPSYNTPLFEYYNE